MADHPHVLASRGMRVDLLVMTRRVRTLSGVLGLVALTLSAAEAGAASVCASMALPDRATEGVEIAPAHEAGQCCSSLHDRAAAAGDDRGEDGRCPWNPMMASGCVAPASLGSSAPDFVTRPPGRRVVMVAPTPLTASHLTDRLFRPPRA